MMTPRACIASLDFDASPEEVIATMEAEPHARYPIVRSDPGDVIGVVSARAVLLALLRGQKLDLEKLAKPPVFVPQSVTGRDILESFRQGRTDMAFVVDEYGSLLGLVTLHDILEAITGQFAGAPEDSSATRREDGSWLFDGQIPMTDLAQHLSIRWPKDGAGEDFDTLGRLILWQLGRIPQATDSIQWHGWQFEVVDMDGQRIDKVLASRTSSPRQVPA